MRMKTNRGGEIVQVNGGPILRSTGRKDRHSKVYTAKGPRDRRVRLAAHTAIQFYDVQDRLGYDRPSKAVDWLINKAKNAIDKLEELPPWNANDPIDHSSIADPNLKDLARQLEPSSYGYLFQQLGQNPSCSSSPFSLQSVNVQSTEDTLKLFVPTSSMNLQNYPSVETGDLCLSLQSLQDPNSSHNSASNQGIFLGSAPATFSASFPRMLDWNLEGRVEFISELSQRETYQSSFSNLASAWNDHPPPLLAGDRSNSPVAQHSPVSRSQFLPEGFSGFQVPARFHGEEKIGTGSGNPSSVSLDSHS